jgi:DNA-binding protein HU-beta
MNKSELLSFVVKKAAKNKKIADKPVSTAQVDAVVEALCETLLDALASGEEITLTGVGKFTTTIRSARTIRNPQTGETSQAPEKRVPKFVFAKKAKETAAGGGE